MENTFTAIDFETASGKRNSICQVGLVRYENGVIANELKILVCPPQNYYRTDFIEIHGITPEMTENAPTFDKIWPQIEPFIAGQNVVAHNGLSFDFVCLLETLKYYRITPPEYQRIDTYRIYNMKLSLLCQEFDIKLDHHDALSDAKACAELYMQYLNEQDIMETPLSQNNKTPKTDETQLSIISDFSDAIKAIWTKYNMIDEEIMGRKFLAPQLIKRNGIMFLGINPSYSKETKLPNEVNYYNLYQSDKPHPYFKKFLELIEGLPIPWSHADLLYFQETQQTKVGEFLSVSEGVGFIWEQLMVSKQILEASQPKVIVASNTLVRHLLGFDRVTIKNKEENVWMGYQFKFDDVLGTHRIITEGPLFNVPIFFTSMLSGQRALDKGSFERLKWHIDFVLKRL